MRIQTKHIINSLPLVADVLGRKYGIKVEIGGDIAATNGRTVYIPSLPLDSGPDVLNMARGFIDHESGHLRHTDFDALVTANLAPIEKLLCNLLEDYRIEKKMAAIFPGCKENLEWLCKHLHDLAEKPDLTGNPALQILDWINLHISSWDVPDFHMEREQASQMLDWCFPGLRQQLEPVLNTAAACADTQGCIDAARELMRLIADYKPPEPEQGQDQQQKSDKAESEDSHGADISDQSPALSENENDGADVSPTEDATELELSSEDAGTTGKKEEDASLTDTTAKNDVEESQQTAPAYDASSAGQKMSGRERVVSALQSLQNLLSDPSPALPSDLGSQLQEVLGKQCQKGGERLSVAVAVPVHNQPLQRDELAAARQATTALRTRLQALLQSTVLARSRSARTGHVDPKNLAKLAVNDPRVFLQKGKRQGVNTAVHILLDSSGSMSGVPIDLACKACFAVASALDAIYGVGVAVTTFPGWKDGTVSPLLKHKERLHDKFSVSAHGGTPLAEAVWWVMRAMHSLAEERKIILLITDGEPDSAYLAQNAIAVAGNRGFEVLGIGINTPSIQNLLPRHGCRVICSLPELAPAMFGMLQATLLKKEGGRA